MILEILKSAAAGLTAGLTLTGGVINCIATVMVARISAAKCAAFAVAGRAIAVAGKYRTSVCLMADRYLTNWC